MECCDWLQKLMECCDWLKKLTECCDWLQKLTEDANDSHMDAQWADNQSLRRQFQGLNNIQFRPGKNM